MRHHPQKSKKQSGFVITVELLFIVTILVIGLVVGWVEVRNAVIAELADTAEAVGGLNQSYSYPGTSDAASTAFTNGSQFTDDEDQGSGFSDFGATFGNQAATLTTVVLPAAVDETSVNPFGP